MTRVLNPREKKIFIITVGILIFSLFFRILIVPLWKHYDRLNDEITLTRSKLVRCLKLLSQKDKIQQRFNSFAAQSGIINSGADPLVAMLAELERLAAETNIKIIDVRPQGSYQAKGGFKELITDIRAEGSMEGLARFIYQVENSLALFRIKRLQINAKANSSNLEFALSVSHFLAI